MTRWCDSEGGGATASRSERSRFRWLSWRQRLPILTRPGEPGSLPAHSRSDLLAGLQGRVDRRPLGDHGRELLGALVADVLELGDSDELHARQAWTRRRPR